MPLMVDPESGRLLVQGGEVLTATLHAGLNAAVATAMPSPTGLAASVGDIERIATEQWNEQRKLSRFMPAILLLALGGLWVLCMLLAYNRFLARLFASAERLKPSQSRTEKLAFNGGKECKLGGGDLKTGWILRRGKPVQLGESDEFNTERKGDPMSATSATNPNPFFSPFDDTPGTGNFSYPGSGASTPSPHPPNSKHRTASLFPPPHITPLWHYIPSAQTLLYTPFARWPSVFRSSINLARLYIIFCYLAFCAIVIIYQSDLSERTDEKGYGRDFARTGNLGMAQIPLALALGVKGNVIGLAMGVGYERLKIFHKFVGRMVFICSTVHTVYFLWRWIKAGTLTQQLARPSMAFAMAGYVGLVLLVVTSLPWIRKGLHGLFKICHVIGVISFLIGMAWHVPIGVPYCTAAVVLYAISIISSITKTRVAHAELLTLPGSDITGIFIPSLRTGWRPGQHVRIRVPALGLKIGWESHPFTISSAPDGEGLVLLCKRAGDWTNALADMAAAGMSADENEGNQTTVTIILEGPYGGHGNTIVSSFSSLMLTAGGSGVSHALSIAHDLLNQAPTGVVRARTIDLIWVVKTESAARGVLPTLLELVNEAKAHEMFCIEARRKGRAVPHPTALRVHIFVTRCPLSSPLTLLSNPYADPEDERYAAEGPGVLFERSNSTRSARSTHTTRSADGTASTLKRQRTDAERIMHSYLARNASSSSTATTSTVNSVALAKRWTPLSSIAAHPGRPDWGQLLDVLADETIRRGLKEKVDPSGMCVTSCGPHQLVDGVRDAVRRLSGWKRRQVGGVDFEEEHFGF